MPFRHRFAGVAALLLLPFIALLSGCSDGRARSVDLIRVMQGDEQCALPGREFPREIRVELLGPQVPGLLGGKGSRAPVEGVRVLFVPVDGSDLAVLPAETISDAGGLAATKVRAGRKTGDQYLKIIPVGFESKSITLRLISGMQIKGDEEEYRTGTVGDNSVEVRLQKDDKPAAGVPVNFKLLATSEGATSNASILSPTVITDEKGVAKTSVKLGQKTGIYQVGIEVVDPDAGFLIRSKTIKLLGFNLWAVVIAVLGGLTLFIFGMKLMGDGIQKVAGENMKKILQFFARNGIVAVLAGTLVTAIIQSSSATTVMVIGFINAGLLTLTQAIGIIFGANVGTTVTAQIISFNLSGLALPAITLGFLITLSKKREINGWGETLLGFGLLFFGMTMMSDELRVLGDFPSFKEFFKAFDCMPAEPGNWMPLGAVLGAIGIGIAATVLIQSSSAAMGIVLALAGSGLINFYTAVPLLLGTNIGTTITAMLAAAGWPSRRRSPIPCSTSSACC